MKKNKHYWLVSVVLLLSSIFAWGQEAMAQNLTNPSFSKAKRLLEEKVYLENSERQTIYCGAQFYKDKAIALPTGFSTQKHKKRANRIEWEHVVPAENFGQTFPEWREGHERCVDKNGKSFKGRRCAEIVNKEYRLMVADMHNLFPAIGAVNAGRSNYNFTMLPHAESDFGICEFKIDGRRVEPPARARGKIARAYLYMENTYPRYRMSSQQRQLMQAWNKQYPVTHDECVRNTRIANIQGNENPFVGGFCGERGGGNNLNGVVKLQGKMTCSQKNGQLCLFFLIQTSYNLCENIKLLCKYYSFK